MKSGESPSNVARALLLARAVELGDAAEVVRLIAAGAAADAPLAGGETLLMRAAARGYADVSRALLDGGAEVNARRPDGFTPLLVAVFRGHEEVVRLLLERDADASVRTRLGATADAWAASHGFAEVAGLLKDAPPVRARADAPVASARAAAQAPAVDERRAPENVKGTETGAGRRGRSGEALRAASPDVETADRRASFLSSVLPAGGVDGKADEDGAAARAEMVGQSRHEAPVSRQGELFASFGARRSVAVTRYHIALTVATALAAFVATLYAFAWRPEPSAGGRTPPAPVGGASNVTSQPSAPAQTAAPNPQPTPGAPPQVAPVIILNPPADVPPVGTNAAAGQSGAPANSSPVVVVEGGAQPPEEKAPRTDATNPADSQRAGEEGKKDKPRGDDARAGEEDPRRGAAGEEEPRRGSQGQGAEIRTAAPARPSAQPSSPARAQPSPTPKKKVIQWP